MFRKFLLLTTLLATAIAASAELRWGPMIGVNFSTLHWKQKLAKTGGLTGGQAGIMGELMIPGIGFGIDLGLRYNLHGAHVNFGDHEIWSSTGIKNQDVWFHTLEIPINLKFKWTRMNGFEQYLAPDLQHPNEDQGCGCLHHGSLPSDGLLRLASHKTGWTAIPSVSSMDR